MSAEPLASARCAQCDAELPPSLLACPSCRALVHAGELKRLAAQADERRTAGDPSGELAAWRSALALLPDGTRQQREVAARMAELARAIDAPRPRSRSWLGRGGAIGGALLAILSKGKLLLLGLTKLTTLASMLVFAGVYWRLWGWKIAVGMVLSIYVHEMGHVIMLRRYGVNASAPMFIPGIGALVRLKQHISDAYQDARVGLAGPRFGLGAALVAYLIGLGGGGNYWFALAQLSGFINLFNLLPLGPLDGGRAFGALDRSQQFLMAAALGGAWYLSHVSLLVILGVMALVRALPARAAQPPSWPIFVEYVTLMAALTWLAALVVPGLR
jgi:Zn-dependent protease